MPPSAGRRRLEKPVEAGQVPGRRAGDRKRGLLSRLKISPAVIGVVALMTAGLGSFASASASAGHNSLESLGYEPAGSPQLTSGYTAAVDDGVDVSRAFDRPTLIRQTDVQARQRARALEDFDRDISARSSDLEREKKQRDERAEKRRKQWVVPVAGYTLTARFGQRSSMWSSGSHTGLDFAGPAGTEIVAIAAGTVTAVGYEGSYGNRTVITLADGTEVSYSHQSSVVVKVGDKVQPGQLVGYTGATGNVTGPHLHLEVKPSGGSLTDPIPVLRAHGVNP
ncbi:MAG: peptidase [Aeromicrobium sp.]|nr:peptidase [Aeromicrobium sp.]